MSFIVGTDISNDVTNVSDYQYIQNPPPFKATGKGWYNNIPNIVADVHNSSGLFVQGVTGTKLYLFVTDVEAGWTLSGDYGQVRLGRTFYPMNIHQNSLTIQGICANQYQYDLLAEFAINHQRQVVDNVNQVVTFKLFPYLPNQNKTRTVSPGIKMDGLITNFTAGHQVFVNAPTWEIDFQVTYDHLSADPGTFIEINSALQANYMYGFGPQYRPPAAASNTTNAPTSGDYPGVFGGTPTPLSTASTPSYVVPLVSQVAPLISESADDTPFLNIRASLVTSSKGSIPSYVNSEYRYGSMVETKTATVSLNSSSGYVAGTGGHAAVWLGAQDSTNSWLQVGIDVEQANAPTIYTEIGNPTTGFYKWTALDSISYGQSIDLKITFSNTEGAVIWLNGSAILSYTLGSGLAYYAVTESYGGMGLTATINGQQETIAANTKYST